MEQLTKNQAVATSQEAVQNQNEPQLRDENAHNDKSVHGVLNPTYQDRKSGSAGMPRPISYAVFCLKKKRRYAARTRRPWCSPRRRAPSSASTGRSLGSSHSIRRSCPPRSTSFFFSATATTEIYTLSLHDALPI